MTSKKWRWPSPRPPIKTSSNLNTWMDTGSFCWHHLFALHLMLVSAFNTNLFCFVLCFLFFLLSSLQCNNDYAPVCGSNNKNYQNECFLRKDACKQQSEVRIMSEGACPAGTYIYIMVSIQYIHSHKHTHTHRSTDATTHLQCGKTLEGTRKVSPLTQHFCKNIDDSVQM